VAAPASDRRRRGLRRAPLAAVLTRRRSAPTSPRQGDAFDGAA
jgi:hypothetical protein